MAPRKGLLGALIGGSNAEEITSEEAAPTAPVEEQAVPVEASQEAVETAPAADVAEPVEPEEAAPTAPVDTSVGHGTGLECVCSACKEVKAVSPSQIIQQ